MAMFIAIATDDFLTFTDNNETKGFWKDYTNKTEYPIFTGMTIEETRDHVENYFRNAYDAGDDFPEYEICEISTAATINAAYKLDISCDYANPAAE